MHRTLPWSLSALLALGCGDSDAIEGLTDECTLGPIVQEQILRGAVDCSPEYADEFPVPLFIAVEQPNNDDVVIDCIRDAVRSRRDAVYLSQLVVGTDSIGGSAKLVSANGRARRLTYDSSPTGQGIGGNTVVLYECAPFTIAPDLRCEDERRRELLCSHDKYLQTRYF